MKLLCFERDNQTHFTSSDQGEETYMASFELFPFSEGLTYSLYKGIFNGKGPLRGEFCVVRAFLEKAADASVWNGYLMRSFEAFSLAEKFNKHIGIKVIEFQTPLLTKIETVSDFTAFFKCFHPHNKQLLVGEYVLLEPFIEGMFRRQFNMQSYASELDVKDEESCSQIVLPGTLNATELLHWPNLAEAYSHFTWHSTRRLVVCGLQGVFSNMLHSFTNPTVHSINRQFGESDRGTAGISEFFASHLCNKMCSEWDTYNLSVMRPPSELLYNDIHVRSEHAAPLRLRPILKRNSDFLTNTMKVTSKHREQNSHQYHPKLVSCSKSIPYFNNLTDSIVHSIKLNAHKSSHGDANIRDISSHDQLVLQNKLTNQNHSEALLPAKFCSHLTLPSKPSHQLYLPTRSSSQMDLPGQQLCRNNVLVSREVTTGGHGFRQKERDDKNPESADSWSDEAASVQGQHAPEVTSKGRASYYSCNPAEPSQPLKRDSTFDVSLM